MSIQSQFPRSRARAASRSVFRYVSSGSKSNPRWVSLTEISVSNPRSDTRARTSK